MIKICMKVILFPDMFKSQNLLEQPGYIEAMIGIFRPDWQAT